jgi:hypothetical protein
MNKMSKLQPVVLTSSLILYVALAGLGVFLYNSVGSMPDWVGGLVGVGAVLSLLVFVTSTAKSISGEDREGVEWANAGLAAMVTASVIVVGGFSYSLLEAFAGLPRLTGAVYAAVAGLVWIITMTWLGRETE